MSRLPTPTLQPVAARIARAVLANDGAEVLALCKELADQFSGSPAAALPASTDERPYTGLDKIGIWARDQGDQLSPYRRLEQRRSEWRLWADNDEIPTPSGRRRIVFLGKSVARGYLYDPAFAPAVVLQRLLRRLPVTQDVDVIDLARSNIDPAGIVRLAAQSARLNPDLFILFAGNNWSSSRFYDRATRRKLIEALARQGYRGYIDAIEVWRARRTKMALEHLADIANRADAPVIVIVPETNLLDWREDRAPIVPILSSDLSIKWFDLASKAEVALDAGCYPEAARLASDLIAIDEGTSPVGPSIVGRCRVAEGDMESARTLFEAARDVCRALPLNTSPGCSKSIQDGLRDSGERHGFHVVDLPVLMRERLRRRPSRPAHVPRLLPSHRCWHPASHRGRSGDRAAASRRG